MEVAFEMVDFHAHCEYSIDARGTIDQYAASALRSGLSHICFTTHCDLDPARLEHDGKINLKGTIVDVTGDWLESYMEEVAAAAAACEARGLKVLCGLEIGYAPGIESLIEKLIKAHRFDYILGGIHVLDGIDIVSPRESGRYFGARTPAEVCEEYFGCLAGAVASGLFDAIAHIDIYKRCGLELLGDGLNQAHIGLIEPVLEEMARRGLCLEVNSGGLRKGLEYPYPSPDILRAAREAGVRSLTVGSDCHRPEDVGQGLDRCLALALEAGFDRITVFEARRRQTIPIGEI
ncbi:MAG: histidinol-phosphatase [Candidatus Eisenbacteria bacterium]